MSCPSSTSPSRIRKAPRAGAHARARQGPVGRRGRGAGRGRGRGAWTSSSSAGAPRSSPATCERKLDALPRPRDAGRARRHAHRAGDRARAGSRGWSPGCASSGSRHVEVSDGTIALDARAQARADRAARRASSPCFSEVGSKDADVIMAPYRWVEQIEARARGGRVEGDRRGARVGDRRASTAPTARSRTGLIDEIVHEIDPRG